MNNLYIKHRFKLNIIYVELIIRIIFVQSNNWLWVILFVAAIGGIISYLSSGKAEVGVAGAAASGIGCAILIFQLFLVMVDILIFLNIAGWLFG